MNTHRFSRFNVGFVLLILFTTLGSLKAEENSLPNLHRDHAVAALEQAVKTDPSNPELWLHMGFAYKKDGKIDQAQKAFEKVTLLDPKEADAFYMLALIDESKRDKAAATKAWKDYLAVEDDGNKRAVAEKHIHHLNQ